jgi:hypothetical protein
VRSSDGKSTSNGIDYWHWSFLLSELPLVEQSSYRSLIAQVFHDRYSAGIERIEFVRDDIVTAAETLRLPRPKNVGDVIYALRYRIPMPSSIAVTQPEGKEWIIIGVGRSRYCLVLVPLNRIRPNVELATIGIPDATPEIIRAYPLDDEQALLAVVRYNRLIDTFLGPTTFSLQNHLRTTVKDIGQIEIDELYFGIDRYGCHYVIPVQAKGGKDQISVVQTKQDLAWCEERYPALKARAISVQFMDDERVAMFELGVENEQVRVIDERHYQLLSAECLDRAALSAYR